MSQYILERRDVVRALIRALQTRRFLILAGLSGTGKTQLARRISRAVTQIDAVWGAGAGLPRVLKSVEATAEGKESSIAAPVPGHPDYVYIKDPGTGLDDGRAHTKRVGFLPVRPDWTDSRAIWGHYNPLTGHFYPTDALIVALNAYRDFLLNGEKAGRYFLILDEMNLARVEYYFSDVLSLMEAGCSVDPKDPSIIRIGETARVHPVDTMLVSVGRRGIRDDGGEYHSDAIDQAVPLYELEGTRWMYEPLVHGNPTTKRPDELQEFDEHRNPIEATFPIPPRICCPPNLTILGTVNVDETTHSFAPKVLDRSFVLQFVHVNFDAAFAKREGYASCRDLLVGLHDAMEPTGRHFGYRVASEIIDYVEAAGGLTPEVGDFLLLGKVLPKLRGTEPELAPVAEKLHALCEAGGYARSALKLERMREELRTTGFSSFF